MTRRLRLLLPLGVAFVVALGGSALALAQVSRGEDVPLDIPVLAYHGVATDATIVHGASDRRFFDVRLSVFRQQMDHLRDAGFHTITPDQYKRWVHGEDVSLPDKPVLITFDDGLTSARLGDAGPRGARVHRGDVRQHRFRRRRLRRPERRTGLVPDLGSAQGNAIDRFVGDAIPCMSARARVRSRRREPDVPPLLHLPVPGRRQGLPVAGQGRCRRWARRDALGLRAARRLARVNVRRPLRRRRLREHERFLAVAAYFATQFPVVFVQDNYAGSRCRTSATATRSTTPTTSSGSRRASPRRVSSSGPRLETPRRALRRHRELRRPGGGRACAAGADGPPFFSCA